jgi:hypothetical protein
MMRKQLTAMRGVPIASRANSLKKSRGKIYSLLLGQCTQVLVDKMKQDADWQAASDSYHPLKLLKLIEKSILKL